MPLRNTSLQNGRGGGEERKGREGKGRRRGEEGKGREGKEERREGMLSSLYFVLQ